MSSAADLELLARLRATGRVNDAQVEKALEAFWAEFKESEDLQSEAKKAGINVDQLLQLPDSPVHAGRLEAQYDVATAIGISIAAGLAKDAIVALWKAFVWPYLESKFGASLEHEEDE
jgi:hypothetical protein